MENFGRGYRRWVYRTQGSHGQQQQKERFKKWLFILAKYRPFLNTCDSLSFMYTLVYLLEAWGGGCTR